MIENSEQPEYSMMLVVYILPIILTTFFDYFARRYNLINWEIKYLLIFIIFITILFASLWTIGWEFFEFLINNKTDIKQMEKNFLTNVIGLGTNLLPWFLFYFGFKIYNQYINQKHNAEKALALAQSSQLEMLRYQLNPHFLFNTLSSLRALIKKKDNDIAEIMVTRISEFLKYSLLDGENSKVPLTKEIKIIRHYFEIEKVRFNDNLVVNYNIDPESENILIPVFLIHPLIENAVKYGMKTSQTPLRIDLKTSVQKNDLLIEIINSGEWYNKSRLNNSTGTGLKNTIERLKLAYPGKHNFEIIKNKDSVLIKITIEY